MPRRAHAPIFILGLLALSGRAVAQTEGDDGGPVIVGERKTGWSGVELVRFVPALDLRWQHERDKNKVKGQPDQTVIEDRYRELLDIDSQFTIGHKNLIDVSAVFQFGNEDIFRRSGVEGDSGHTNSLIGLWDINALVFGASELPTNIYSRRSEDRQRRPFAGALDQTTTETGIATRYQTDFMALTAEYFHREQEITDDLGDISTTTTQDTFTTSDIFNIAERQKLEFNYTLDMVDESQSGGYSDSYTRHDGLLTHNWTFGDEGIPHELRSQARVYNQSGSQDINRFRWDEFLTLRHTDRFETRHNLVFDQLEVRDSSRDLVRFENSAKHRLFDSLTSLGTLGAQRISDAEGFTSDELFLSGQLDYTKSVPLGRLDAAAGLGYNTQMNSDRGSTFRVLDEAHVYNDGFPTILNRRNIVPGSVEVRPAANATPYQEGIDYTVQYFPDRTEIRGVLTGALVSGQTIRVTYDVGPESGYDVDTLTTSWALRYTLTEGTFKGLAGYTTYRTTEQTISADDPSLFTPDDTKDLLVGLEYRRAEWFARAEYNIHDSTISPYNVARFLVNYSLQTGTGSAVNAEVSREMIEFTDESDDVTLDRARVEWITRLDEAFSLILGATYRHEDSSVNGTTDGLEEHVTLNFRKRQTSIYATLTNSNLEGPNSESESQLFEIGLRRSF
ncbi:MAG: hypothetical protein IT434_13500 [Phycisphaerales bacterium]|jgi:hypothetical protein|nr:hypothetical protein [Phycisphaerales bacterium]